MSSKSVVRTDSLKARKFGVEEGNCLYYLDLVCKLIKNISNETLGASFEQLTQIIDKKHADLEFVFNCIDFSFRKYGRLRYILAELYGQLMQHYNITRPSKEFEMNQYLKSKGFSVKFFLSQKPLDIDYFDIYPKGTPFYYAAWDMVEELQKIPNIDPNAKSKQISLTDVACLYGSQKCYEYLSKMDWKPTSNSLSNALIGNNLNIIQDLLNKGAVAKDIHFSELDDDVANFFLAREETIHIPDLCVCIKMCNISAVLFTIQNSLDTQSKYASLNAAIEMDLLEVFRLLDELGFNVTDHSYKDMRNRDYLLIAIENKALDIVQYLVEKGADVNKTYSVEIHYFHFQELSNSARETCPK